MANAEKYSTRAQITDLHKRLDAAKTDLQRARVLVASYSGALEGIGCHPEHVEDSVAALRGVAGCEGTESLFAAIHRLKIAAAAPIPMVLTCPGPSLDGEGVCGARHLDEGEWLTRVHHTHSCQKCGFTFRPAVVATVGVRFLPGFKNETPK